MSIWTTSRSLTRSVTTSAVGAATLRFTLLVAAVAAVLVGCMPARDYSDVDPTILNMCTEEARSLKIAADTSFRDPPPAGGPDNSAQRALADAQRARDEQRRSTETGLGDWPLVVLVDQCLVENGQPIPEDAADELTRWTRGEAQPD